ncbi:Arylsulfatase [Pontiella sulfatireligans]|uniref:Arylsulfatase n=2 Tax=Pontiella sulfatireligans TaxID=2750658 RepID=A0A6C2UEV8_9BACT|nr:sulfatase S1_16 [Kiritimatiellales bacterium]VGO18648.1 Arylsulfatase [Pontiella sulfatireligans]
MQAAGVQAKPNIVFVLADDLGYGGLGCYGSTFAETPNIDRLAREGMRFTQGYACAPNCAPSRAAIVSGQYPTRTGILRVQDRFKSQKNHIKVVYPKNKHDLDLSTITIAEALKKEGYRTAFLGKWHMGHGEEFHASRQGFDLAIESAGKKHFGFKTIPKTDIPKDVYLADYLTDRSLEFIDACRKDDEPFFLYLAHYAIHIPLEAKKEYLDRFREKLGADANPVVLKAAAMTASLDDSVGRLIAKLESTGQLENTLFVFSSDNGGYASGGKKDPLSAFNVPFRGMKKDLYEGGIRVPYIFHWPGKIKPGTVCEEPIIGVDLYPTFVEFAGGKPETSQILDGESLWPCLLPNGNETLERDAIYWFFPNWTMFNEDKGEWFQGWRNAIRQGDYKLIEHVDGGKVELYNLSADPGEENDLSQSNPEKTAVLQRKLADWKKHTGAPAAVPNPNYTP